MRVGELWRYPVKSLRGELLEEADLTEPGIVGDRLVQVMRPHGRVFTSRTHPGLLGLQGSLDSDGMPTIDGIPWDEPPALAAVGVDRRRFRPNVYVEGVDGLAEREWVGRSVRLGSAVVGVRQVRGRCVMTTFDPDTLEQDITVLQKIVWELGGRTALDCYVLEPGRVRVGDEVEVGEYWTLPHRAA